MSESSGGGYGVEVFEGNGAIYLGAGFKKAPNGFTDDGNICAGAQTFPGVTLSSNNYEGGIHDISILPRRAIQKSDQLTEEQRALRSDL